MVREIDYTNTSTYHLCSQCQTSFKSKSGLKRHSMVVHEGKKQFSCSECSLNFYEKRDLKLHFYRKHANSQANSLFAGKNVNNVCSECQKSFSEKSSLVRHFLLMHVHEKKMLSRTKENSENCVELSKKAYAPAQNNIVHPQSNIIL